MSTTKVETEPGTVTITRIFNSPREVVYDAWADADKRKAWSGCQGSTCVSYTHEFRAGGSYRQVLEIPNCGEVVMVGSYTAIEKPGEIAYTMSCEPGEGMPATPESNVLVKFIDHGDSTELRLTHTGLPDDESREAVSGGHQASPERLSASLEPSK